MEKSVTTVGEQVLVGRKISDVVENTPAYEKLIKDVFDRVLVGYSVQNVRITSGPDTRIEVTIAPWGDVVKDVKLELDLSGISPGAAALVQQEMGDMRGKIGEVLIGMPVDSVDWVGGISKTVMRDLLAAQLPEFQSNLDITAGTTTTVRISLMPSGPTIQDVKVVMRSGSIPNFLLLNVRSKVEEAALSLRGLPVHFVERHRNYFSKELEQVAGGQPAIERYGLKLNTTINADTESTVIISAETTKFNIWLEGYLDLGRNTDETSAKLHVGKYVSSRDELFLETTFNPGSVTWQFMPGWGHRFAQKTEFGIKYNVNDERDLLYLKQDLGRNWSIRLERTPANGYNELGVRYKLHDFLSAEYVFTSNEKWLRLVGNL
jgi:hypothetical protein